jgi:hypothetical protein
MICFGLTCAHTCEADSHGIDGLDDLSKPAIKNDCTNPPTPSHSQRIHLVRRTGRGNQGEHRGSTTSSTNSGSNHPPSQRAMTSRVVNTFVRAASRFRNAVTPGRSRSGTVAVSNCQHPSRLTNAYVFLRKKPTGTIESASKPLPCSTSTGRTTTLYSTASARPPSLFRLHHKATTGPKSGTTRIWRVRSNRMVLL